MILNLLNFKEHPEFPKYTVFQFKKKEMAQDFQHKLDISEIPFKMDTAPDKQNQTRYLYAVERKFLKEVHSINNIVLANFRTKFIPNRGFRWILMVISFTALAVAFIGYFTV